MFFQIYGKKKILTITSKIKIIGTISIAGKIKEIKDMHVAENPKPLKPLIMEAINTINKINKKWEKLKSI